MKPFYLSLILAACSADKSDSATPAAEPEATIPAEPVDADQDGFSIAEDCDDENPAIHPDADEICDGIDNNCDDAIDGPDAVDQPSWYPDGDDDGFGVTEEEVISCEAPAGHAAKPGDCNDDNADINPFADELCDNGIDEDCNGHIDDHPVDEQVWYEDLDGDGYGDGAPTMSCGEPFPGSYAPQTGDCNDNDSSIHPGATEIAEDGVDQDCDGQD